MRQKGANPARSGRKQRSLFLLGAQYPKFASAISTSINKKAIEFVAKMTYQIIARKFRPQSFAEVVGQGNISKTLKSAIVQNRVSQAYLFSGTRGVGKTTIARILAKALNCHNPIEGEPCLACTSCQEIKDGCSPDVMEIDGASNRGIDEIRDLRENIGYLPSGGKNKIYIIDEVHMLTTEAFNALLKTLEEPPPHVKFIFATTDPQKVPETISSRCQNFKFSKIAGGEIENRLQEIAQKEKVSATPEALKLIAKHTDGSLRDAESIFDQLVSFADGKIDESHVAMLFGIPPTFLARELAKSIYCADVKTALTSFNQMKTQGFQTLSIFDGCFENLRELFLAKLEPKKEFPAEWELTPSQIAARTVGEIEQMMELFFKWRPQVARSDLADILVEFIIAKASQIEPALAIGEALEKLDLLQKELNQMQTGHATKTEIRTVPTIFPTVSKNPDPPPGEQKDTEWFRFLQTLAGENPILHAQLSAGNAQQMADSPIVIEFPENYALLPRLKEAKMKETLIHYLEQFLGKKTEVILEGKKGSKGNWKFATGREYLKDPIIQKTLKMLDGKIINVEEVKK